jgi:hypothetical protein
MAITKGKNDDLRYELIGILGGLDLKERWEPFLNNTLIDFIRNNLTPGICEDDILLETIMWVASIA